MKVKKTKVYAVLTVAVIAVVGYTIAPQFVYMWIGMCIGGLGYTWLTKW